MELTVDQALQQAVAAHKEGKLHDAECLYRAILQAQANHPDANHNLGVLAVAVGKPLEAVTLFKLALEANPQIEQFWLSYIDALIKLERFEEAKRVLVEGEKSGVASQKLEFLHQQIPKSPPSKNNKRTKQGLTLSQKRKGLAQKKKHKKRKAQGDLSGAAPSQDQINLLLDYYQAGRVEEAEELATLLTQRFPKHPFGWKALGLIFSQTGRLDESLLPVQKSVELSPKDAEAHYNLGITLQELGRLDDAEASYGKAIALQPDLAKAHSNLGITLQELGRLDDAEASYRKAIALQPDYAKAHSNLGNTLRELGRLDDAEASYRKAIALQPDYAKAHSNLGNTLRELGRLEDAEASYRKAIALQPDYARAHSNLGITLQELGRLDDAEASYRKAIALQPDLAKAHSNLGNTLQELGRLDDAEASYRKAIALQPDYARAHYNLGNTLQELGRFDDAEASYRKAIALRPDLVEAHLNLCEILEKTNAIDTLLIALEDAMIKAHTMKADFLYYKALVSYRKEHYAEADTLVTQITEDEVGNAKKARYYKLVGDLRHRSQDYDAAFFAYKSGNQAVKAELEYQMLERAAEHYFEVQRNTARKLTELSMGSPYQKRLTSDVRQPTFLVGFPRSGTTLLDTILRTHSKMKVVEEQPMLDEMESALGDLYDVNDIEVIDENELGVASNAYLDELAKHADWTGGSLVIDKLPLNLLKAPLIHQVFPEAKFILALRHPFDCILSCWMQTFKLNKAMANMVDLDRIVDFYCVAMDIFHLSQQRYELDVHRIRYEDLIEDFEAETTSVLRFLGLEWEPGLVNYRATALARRRIDTPSYSQVIKPIYKTGAYRWKYYEKHLDKYKSQLAPWFEKFGY